MFFIYASTTTIGEVGILTSLSVDYETAVFPTALGWMALAGRDDKLGALTFGHDDPKQAMAALSLPLSFATGSNGGVWTIRLTDRLQAYAAGAFDDFANVAIEMDDLTGFQQAVIRHCRAIPYGQTLTYGQLAALAGSPRAARAVGNTMAQNLTPLVVPCHRVVPAGAGLGGYSARGGVRMKLRLLETEAARRQDNAALAGV